MSTQRMLGIVLLIIGVILLVMGRNASHSMADQVNNTFTGRFTDRTTWFIVGGIGLGLLGLVMAIFSGGRRRLA